MSAATYIITPTAESEAARQRPVVASPTAFLDLVSSDLEAIEARMNADLGSDVRTVYALTRHLMNAGGKRLRPAMLALSARAIAPDIDSERLATVGAAVEFVHMASLVHDDVVDNTATRRGKPTANAVFGNGVAVLSGDYILARAMRLLTLHGDLRILRTVSEITIEMSEGEVMEIAATGDFALPLPNYVEILRKKTATFVEGCCRCGAILAKADEATENALSDYGYQLGMAFQIADDLLDYTGDPAITGKPRGSDLRDGRATLPLLLALQSACPAEQQCVLAAFGNAGVDDAGVLAVCDILAAQGAFEQTRQVAGDHVRKAELSLAILPPTPARDAFAALTQFVVQRDR